MQVDLTIAVKKGDFTAMLSGEQQENYKEKNEYWEARINKACIAKYGATLNTYRAYKHKRPVLNIKFQYIKHQYFIAKCHVGGKTSSKKIGNTKSNIDYFVFEIETIVFLFECNLNKGTPFVETKKAYRTNYLKHFNLTNNQNFNIHHLNFDRECNDLGNLVLLPAELHASIHRLILSLSSTTKSTLNIDVSKAKMIVHDVPILQELANYLYELDFWITFKNRNYVDWFNKPVDFDAEYEDFLIRFNLAKRRANH